MGLPETRISEAREPPKLGIILVGVKPPALLPCCMGMEPDKVPLGEVRPYAWFAREAGSPKASRAVGTVMANNPVPLLIPCHRVVRNDGTTGQYAFGAEKKVGLLEREGVPVGELAGTPYLATPTTGIFCHATCRNARRIKPENRRRFRSAEAATNAGYRPCRVCRPVVAG